MAWGKGIPERHRRPMEPGPMGFGCRVLSAPPARLSVCLAEGELVLPEADIDQSLDAKGAIACKAVRNGQIVGGAVVVLDREKKQGHLDLLYVRHGEQGKGIGKWIWSRLEELHPEITVWETCTPYFERRNIHFYVNVCGFHIVEYFHEGHKDPREPEDAYNGGGLGIFAFRKQR